MKDDVEQWSDTEVTCDIDTVFSQVDLNWKDHVVMDQSLLRPSEVMVGYSNPKKAEEVLGWRARYDMHDTARMMVDAQLSSSK